MNAEELISYLSTVNGMLARNLDNEAHRLSVDAFADNYRQIISDTLARAGYVLDPEEAYQFAADIWGYLRRRT